MISNISLVSVCRNEGHRLKEWYEYHSKMFSDIVIVDQNSDDNTNLLKNSIKIYNDNQIGWSELSREYACSLAKNVWILYLDIDEMIVLDNNIIKQSINTDICGYRIFRDNYVDDILQETDNQYRLFNKTKSIFYKNIHTQIRPSDLNKSLLLHKNLIYIKHLKSTDEYNLDKNRYEKLKN